MNDKPEQNKPETHFRLPNTLSVKEIMTLVGVIVTIMLAWGMFSTRIAVLETNAVETNKLRAAVELLTQKQHNHELQYKELEGIVRELQRRK